MIYLPEVLDDFRALAGFLKVKLRDARLRIVY